MNRNVIISCAIMGAGETTTKHPGVPITPEQIANSAIEAARAGAAIAHCHVRGPETGKASRDLALYREVVERIRESDADVVINLTSGMGGDLYIGPLERLVHNTRQLIRQLRVQQLCHRVLPVYCRLALYRFHSVQYCAV